MKGRSLDKTKIYQLSEEKKNMSPESEERENLKIKPTNSKILTVKEFKIDSKDNE